MVTRSAIGTGHPGIYAARQLIPRPAQARDEPGKIRSGAFKKRNDGNPNRSCQKQDYAGTYQLAETVAERKKEI